MDIRQETTYTIDDLETLKVVSDPLRVRILEALGRERMTVKSIAAKLGIPPKKLYYHINLLEAHGLIVAAHSQLVSGILEKWYQLRALHFTVAKDLLVVTDRDGEGERGRAGIEMVLETLLGNALTDLRRALAAGLIADQQQPPGGPTPSHSAFLQRHILHLEAAQRETFLERLAALIDAFSEAEAAPAHVSDYGLTLVFTPLASPPNGDTTEGMGDRS